jgi:MFS family permease
MDYPVFPMLSWLADLDFEYKLGIAVFVSTVSAYALLLYLGRRWRRRLEAEGVTYWKAPKGERIAELIRGVWEPRKVSLLYGLAYFSNGYVRTSYSLWIPVFLLNVVGVSTLEAALFVGLMYFSWSWKMFIGFVADGVPISWCGRRYRRLPWFAITGFLYLVGILIMLLGNIEEAPVWTVTFPAVVTVLAAGAFYDMAADSYAVDVTPPEYHARVMGSVSTAGQSIGSALATILPLYFLGVGGYKLVFVVAGLTGLTSLLFLTAREPELESERVFSRRAIAFTFTEKTVILAALVMFARAFTPQKITAPLGGMFTFTIREIVSADPSMVSVLGLAATLAGLPGALLGGSMADKHGHKRMFAISSVAFTGAGLLWATLSRGAVLWFVVVAMISSFLERFWTGTIYALMADATPLALSSTVYQMYMSWAWIGNIPASILMGYLLGFDLRVTAIVMSALTFTVLVLGWLIQPFEAGKAMKV